MNSGRPEIQFETVRQTPLDDAAARQYPYVFHLAYLDFLEQQSARRAIYAVSSDGEARLSNVEGTKLEGIQRLKARFGGALVEGRLWKSDITPNVARLFDLAVAVQRTIRRRGQTKSADIIDQECRKDLKRRSLPRARMPEPQPAASS